MSRTGDIRLGKEFNLLQALQRDARIAGIVRIEYNPRDCGDLDKWVSILESPADGRYPCRFRLTYTMPMYVGPGQLVKDWHASFIFEVSEELLTNPRSDVNVSVDDGFPCGVPFHNHVNEAWVCSGSAWGASRGMGIWYFVICFGCLLNMERFVMAEDGPHLNGEAFEWWMTERQQRPVSNIEWPFDLLEKMERKLIRFGETSKAKSGTAGFTFCNTVKARISFGKRTN